ncbi:MAG: reverse transcriptase family protein [Patescibacteria group bacterium]
MKLSSKDRQKSFTLQDVFGVVSVRKCEYILGEEIQQLERIARNVDPYYNPFQKKKGKKIRQIDNPRGELKLIQSKIKDRILSKLSLPENMLGGVKGKSIKDNACIHKDQKVVVNIDLKNCFPNISHKMIFAIYRNVLCYSTKLSSLLTKLTTYEGHLPQGSPASTILANLALIPLYNSIKEYTDFHKLNMSMWVDDITVSGDYADNHLMQIVKMVQNHCFSLSNGKINIMKHGMKKPQIVTGLAVNKTVGIPKEKMALYINEIKQLLLNPQTVKKSSLDGKLKHVKYINQKQYKKLDKLLQIKTLR